MADIAKAALRNRVLEKLGVLAAGDTAATADQTLVDEAIDAAHEELRKLGLVPFATSAIPSWAQLPLRDWVEASVGQVYGKDWSDGEVEQRQRIAERRLHRQISGFRHNTHIPVKYF